MSLLGERDFDVKNKHARVARVDHVVVAGIGHLVRGVASSR